MKRQAGDLARRRAAAIALLATLAGAACSGGGAAGGTPVPSDPLVTSVEPADGASGVPPAALVVVEFAETVDPATIGGQVRLTGSQGAVRADVWLTGSGRSIVLNPRHDLARGRSYTIRLDAGIGTAGGSALGNPIQTRFSTSDAPRPGPVVRMDPLSGDFYPFPSDLFTRPDPGSATGLRLNFPRTQIPVFMGASDLEALDGFSTTARAVIALDKAIDPSGLPDPLASDSPASPVQLLDVDPASPSFGRRLKVIAELDPFGLGMNPPRTTLTVRPLFPLAAGRRHAIVVARWLTGADGSLVEPSPSFEAIRDGGETPLEARDFVNEVRETLTAIERAPFDPPIPRADAALCLPFTTMSAGTQSDGMRALRDALLREARVRPPAVRIESVERPAGSAALTVRGKLRAFVFQDSNGRIEPSAYTSSPIVAPEHDLDFVLTIPLSAASRPARIAVFQHGINDGKEALFRISEPLAREGIALVGIDAVEHGSRRTDGPLPTALKFVDLTSLARFRDNVRQTIADMVQVVRAVEGPIASIDLLPEGAPDGRPDIDAARVGFVGESLGGIIGTVFLAIEPDVGAGVPFVAGGSWTEIALESYWVAPGGPFHDLVPFLLDALKIPAEDVLAELAMGQTILDAADPLVCASHTISDPLAGSGGRKHVLHPIAIGDDAIPNRASEATARAYPLALLGNQSPDILGLVRGRLPAQGNGPGGVTAGLFPFTTVNGGEPVCHGCVLDSREGIQLILAFLGGYFDGGVPVIVDPTPSTAAASHPPRRAVEGR